MLGIDLSDASVFYIRSYTRMTQSEYPEKL